MIKKINKIFKKKKEIHMITNNILLNKTALWKSNSRSSSR